MIPLAHGSLSRTNALNIRLLACSSQIGTRINAEQGVESSQSSIDSQIIVDKSTVPELIKSGYRLSFYTPECGSRVKATRLNKNPHS